MNKISLIIQREYLNRVKKKSFLLMSLLGPLLMVGLVIVQYWIATSPEDVQRIAVVDESNLMIGKLASSDNLQFHFSNKKLSEVQAAFYNTEDNLILYIPPNILASSSIQIFYKKQPGMGTSNFISSLVEKKLEEMKLLASGIDPEKLISTKTKVSIIHTQLDESGAMKNKSQETGMVLGFIGGILIYLFIFLYGAQVMRGVIEEKAGRIIEVIVSSVKPFELMMGKIIGIAMVGLTQFILWILLSAVGIGLVGHFVKEDDTKHHLQEKTFKVGLQNKAAVQEFDGDESAGLLNHFFDAVNIPVMIGSFLFYFLGGYLLYGALFAAVGAAVDTEADTQQFMLPVTIPLIMAFSLSQQIITNPQSDLAFWLSIFPLTSPVVMMVRIPFGVAYNEIAISMLVLVAGFVAATWVSAKIYSTGILMYGKKATYKELWKWLTYKN